MTGFWVLAALLTLGSVAGILAPLLRRRSATGDEADPTLGFFRDQLAEVDRDEAAGTLAEADAAAARAEIKRRLLAHVRRRDGDGHPSIAGRRGAWPAVVTLLAVPALALGLYGALGSPHLSDKPISDRPGSQPGPGDPAAEGAPPSMEAALARLAEHLAQRPDDGEGWRLLARARMGMGLYDEAATAFERALAVTGDDANRTAELAADLGEARVAAAGGQVTAAAADAFALARGADPDQPKALYYLALAKEQAGDVRGALDGWVELARRSPADAPWLPHLKEQIVRTAAALGVPPPALPSPAP